MAKRTGLLLVLISVLFIGAAYASAFGRGGAPAWAAWLIALGTAGSMTGLFVLGAARHGRLDARLTAVFAAVFVIVAGCFAAALALPAREGANGPLLLGLPLRTAIVLYGIGILPFLILPLAYALTFDELVLSEADLLRVRAAYSADGALGARLSALGYGPPTGPGVPVTDSPEPRAESAVTFPPGSRT